MMPHARAANFFFNTLGKINYPVVVQSKSNYGSTSPIAMAFTNNVTAGNTLIACGGYNWGTNPTISDTRGNTWVQDFLWAGDGTGWVGIVCFRASNVSGGATTVNFDTTSGAGQHKNMVVIEVSGLTNSSPFDKSNRATGSGASITSTTTAVAQSCELVLAYAIDWNNYNTYTIPSGWTAINYVQPSSGQYISVLMEQNAKTGLSGNQSATVTRSAGSGTWYVLVTTYKCS